MKEALVEVKNILTELERKKNLKNKKIKYLDKKNQEIKNDIYNINDNIDFYKTLKQKVIEKNDELLEDTKEELKKHVEQGLAFLAILYIPILITTLGFANLLHAKIILVIFVASLLTYNIIMGTLDIKDYFDLKKGISMQSPEEIEMEIQNLINEKKLKCEKLIDNCARLQELKYDSESLDKKIKSIMSIFLYNVTNNNINTVEKTNIVTDQSQIEKETQKTKKYNNLKTKGY